MVDVTPMERRKHPRRTANIAAHVIHDPTGRTFPCRIVDASATGAMLLVPLSMPVRAGHTLEIQPNEPLVSELSDLSGLTSRATVIRVDRDRMILEGHIAIGVRFESELV